MKIFRELYFRGDVTQKQSKSRIDLFHRMMTKYSCYDHSHSIETAAPVPEIDDLEKDLNAMLGWTKDYKKRREEAKDKAAGKA